jgi:hypothetical protein
MFQNTTGIWYSSWLLFDFFFRWRWAANLIDDHVVHLKSAGDGEPSHSRAAAARAARNCPRRCKREEGDALQ